MLSLNASGFACSFNEANIENLRHDKGGKKEFTNKRSRKGVFYNVLSCLHHTDPIKTFWTFTVAELQDNYPVTDRQISKAFGTLLNGLSKRYARKQANGLKNYVWVSEAQERGNIHFHLVTSTKFIDVQFVQNWWNKLLNQESKNSVHVDPVDQQNIRNVSAYFAKYMSKNHFNENEVTSLKSRVIYARSFGYSKNFPIVDKISVNPKELLEIFPDLQDKKVTKEIYDGVAVDYYFLDSRKVFEFMAEKEREREAVLMGLSKSTQLGHEFEY